MKKADYLAFPAIVETKGRFNNMRKRWDEHHFKCHLDRIAKTKHMVDDSPPRTYLHCHQNMKKIQDRQMAIERDNRLLASRIARIMGTKGSLDNWNDYQPKPRDTHRDLTQKALSEDHARATSPIGSSRLTKYPENPRPTRPCRLPKLV